MAYKQSPKSPALKALIGNQKNLNEGLKKAILESGEKASMAKQTMGMQNISQSLPDGELVKELTQEERLEMAKKKAAARKKAKQKRTSPRPSKNIKPAKKKKPIVVEKPKEGKEPIVVEKPGKGPIAKPISEGKIKVKK